MTLHILGLDPGGTTGWGLFSAEERYDHETRSTMYDKPKFTCGELGAGDKHEHHDELWTLMELQQSDHFIIVCESFEYRNTARAGLELISKEYIGVVKLFEQQRMHLPDGTHMPSQKLVFQTASMGKVGQKSFVKKRNLQRLGLWSPTEGNHAMDGYGHLIFWMIHYGNVMKQELLTKGWK